MKNHSEYVDYLVELMAAVGGVSAKRMFGGAGIFKDGCMFGLVADDVLYLKTDTDNRAQFVAVGSEPFLYTDKNRDKPIAIHYYRCPDEALESPALMAEWARSGFAAALRAKAGAKKTSRKK